jgi:uncharacterized membrane protein
LPAHSLPASRYRAYSQHHRRARSGQADAWQKGSQQVSLEVSTTPPKHPALVGYLDERARNIQNQIADAITRFAGSMPFIYIHIAWFTLWLALKVESFPYGLLTMMVSLEAIFLSTFVMISQNRADAKRQALADSEWEMVQVEQQQNEQLINISQQILTLTQQVHQMTSEVNELIKDRKP